MRGGTFNLLYGRDPLKVQAEVAGLCAYYDLDFIGLQETTDYYHELDNIPGYALVKGNRLGDGAHTEVALLVRNDHEVIKSNSKPFGNGWFGVRAKVRMKPRVFLKSTVKIKKCKLRIAVAHNPASVDLKTKKPSDRYQDFVAMSKRIRSFFAGWSPVGRVCLLDGNCKASVGLKHSPRWVANKTNAELHSPSDDSIDYLITKGFFVDGVKKVKFDEKSDHNPVIFFLRDK